MEIKKLFINGVEETDKEKCIEFVSENYGLIKNYKVKDGVLYVYATNEREK